VLSNSNRSVTLNVNRLSGRIPGELTFLVAVNILQANMFGCEVDRSDLPPRDPNYQSYDCGSDSMNETLYAYGALLITLIMVVLTVGIIFRNYVNACIKVLAGWLTSSIMLASQISMFSIVVRVVNGLIFFSILMLLPMCVILSEFSSTVTHRYGWLLSMVYLQGKWAAVSMLVVFGLLLAVLMVLLSRLLVGVSLLRPLSSAWQGVCSTNSIKIIVWTMISAGVVMLVNVGYVSVVSNGQYSYQTLQSIAFLLSVFKLVWNQLLFWFVKYNAQLPWLLRCDIGLMWLVGAALFNNILVPYLAEAFMSPDCFLYALRSAPSIEVTYPSVQCTAEEVCYFAIACHQFVTCDHLFVQSTSTTTILPIFQYSFQCSSSLLSAFVPVFLFRFWLCGLVQPVVLVIARLIVFQLSNESLWGKLLSYFILRLRWSFVGNRTVDQQNVFANRIVSSMILTIVVDASIVLTFGMLFPLLAVIGLLSIVKDVYCYRLLFGEWLQSIQDAEGQSRIELMNSWTSAWNEHRKNLYLLLVVVVWMSSILLSWTVFDTYGDVVGVMDALWVVFVLPLTAVVTLLLGRFMWGRYGEVETTRSIVLLELVENPIVK
jgi:hypothetical protein